MYLNRRKWKKAVCMLLCVICFVTAFPTEVKAAEYWPDGPEVGSPCVILMEMTTGAVLYEKNCNEQNYPASITKILTTLIALENSELDEVVTFSTDAIDKTEGSGIARDYGEQMTMEQCLYAVMLSSANECAYAVAEHVGGTIENFVVMMNEKAQELGCTSSHFANPHGLFDESHYTSCYDMALIARAAYENETFRIITGTARYTIPPTNKHAEETPLQNHNEMLYPWQYLKYRYEYCTGGKTGYTDVARTTLVTFAEKDGMKLVCVVMRTERPNQWLDSTNLFNYGFDNFQLFNVAENENSYDTSDAIDVGALNNNKAFVEIDKNGSVVLPKTTEFSDAVSEILYDGADKDVVGTISYTYAGKQVGSADIVKTGVEVQGVVFDNEKEVSEDINVHINPPTVLWAVLGIGGIVLLIFGIKYITDNYYIFRHNIGVKKYRREQQGSANIKHRWKRR